MDNKQLRNFHGQLVDALGSSIVSGRYAEGSQMPTEPQLAEQHGASRLVIREAIKSLAAKGLVSVGPRVGTRVLPRQQWNLFDPEVLRWHGERVRDKKLVADLVELRQAIEPYAARLAALRRTAEEMTELRQAYADMARSTSRGDYLAADLRFHGVVVRACRNQFITQLETALSAVWKTSFEASTDGSGPDAEALALHGALVDAIDAKNMEQAEQATLALLARAVARIAQAGLGGQ